MLNLEAMEWQTVQQHVIDAVLEILNSGQQTILNCAPNITVGFDDGDLERVK